jgi:cytosine/adenosine deaminase-related metal-dependent hydrolase
MLAFVDLAMRAIGQLVGFLVIALACFSQPLPQPTRTNPVVFTHVSVVSMKADEVLPDQSVVVDGGKIVKIGPASSISAPAQAIQVDGAGKYLIPGLADLHVHLFSPDDLFSYLANGVTTVLNMDGGPMHLHWREQVRQGTLLGPTIYTAGHTTDGFPPLNEMFVTAETPAQAADLVRETKRAGYDFVKLYGTLRPDVFRTVLETAEREKIPAAGHINRQVGALEVLKSKQVLAAHLEDLIFSRFDHPPSDAEMEEFATAIATSGMTVTPNLNVNPSNSAQLKDLDGVLKSEQARWLPPAAYSQWMPSNNRNDRNDVAGQLEQMATVQKALYKLVVLLHEKGVRLVLGTDAAPYGFPGISAHEELSELVEAGFSPYQALLTATRNAGSFLAETVPNAKTFGTVEEGSAADLVLLSADPLADIHNTRRIAGVMINGRWLPVTELEQLRTQAQAHWTAIKQRLAEIDTALELGDVAKAEKTAAPLPSEPSPWIAEWVLMTKARKLQSTKPAAAIEIARWSTRLYPDSFSAFYLLADLLFQDNNLKQSELAALESKKLEPNNAANLNLLEKLGSLQEPLHFSVPGIYQVLWTNDQSGDVQDSSLLIEPAPEGHWRGKKRDSDGQLTPLRSVYAGGNRLWAAGDTPFGPLEFRITVKEGNLSGYWAGTFGRNGKLTGKKVSN